MKSVVFLQNRNFYGNKLIHIPLLYALKKKLKSSETIVFSPYESGMLFSKIGLASSVQFYSPGLLHMKRKLKQLKPDLVLSLRPSSQWLDMAVGLCGAKKRLGFRTTLSKFLFTHTVPRDFSLYRALDFMRLLEPIGVKDKLGSFFYRQREQATLRLPEGRDWYCLIPGGGTGVFKRWSIERFLELCRLIRQENLRASFLFILGDKEKEYVKPIKTSPDASDAIILFKEKIANLSEAFSSSKATIANDCGPAQIAQMMKVPYVGLFSNHEGRADEWIAEWFLPHEQATAIVSEDSKDINSISADNVHKALKRIQ
jgi:ADP-heptose:LPS heptosyltransferase